VDVRLSGKKCGNHDGGGGEESEKTPMLFGLFLFFQRGGRGERWGKEGGGRAAGPPCGGLKMVHRRTTNDR